jgi:glycyl-tRNA synthetase beta chain
MPEHADLLFEVGTEELPPGSLSRLSEALLGAFTEGLIQANLDHGPAQPYATPRRLGLEVARVALRQPDREVERRGPAVAAAFDANGRPTRAAEGFARSCGTDVGQLERLETPKGQWLVHRYREKGRSATELLPMVAEEALRRLPIPKRMRWGTSEAEFVRPVHWVVFLHGHEVVPCTLLDAGAGRATRGHRFLHPDPIEIAEPGEYVDALTQTGKVMPVFAQRREAIRRQVGVAAEQIGGHAVIDDDLLDEVAALVEWPVAIAGSFEEKYLAVPHEALILTMKKNQKYFPVVDDDQALIPHFITVANIESPQPELIRAGNERVIRPRLADAMFFWQQDGKRGLESHLETLKSIVFQQRLGSLYQKSERVAGLARRLAAPIGGDPVLAERAGMLSRCDLVTEMVFEFPEMQGFMGRYQAERDGEPVELARALAELYLPRFAGDDLPRTPTGQAIALADKLDTLVGIFGIGQKPSGDKDPFGLRRAALGVLRILIEGQLPIDLMESLEAAQGQLRSQVASSAAAEVFDFIIERLRGYYGDRGVPTRVFDAVSAVRPTSPADFDRRIRAVMAFNALPEAESLAAANKRTRNILRKAEGSVPSRFDADLLIDPAEQALGAELRPERLTELGQILGDGADYVEFLTRLAHFREPVDRFFDEVMVMVEDPQLRRNRLALLRTLSDLFSRVADISRLQA